MIETYAGLPDTHIPEGAKVPLGTNMHLEGRGTTFVRYAPGPPGAPTVLLNHGWLASGALNWYLCFEPLTAHFNVLALDHRGHGRGIRSSRRFRLADCATDAAAVLEKCESGPVIAVGYSMGGPISQLLWKQNPELVSGLVLIATGAEFFPGNRHRYAASALLVAAAGGRVGGAVTRVPMDVARRTVGGNGSGTRPADLAAWGRQEMTKHSPRALLEAAHAIANFSSRRWVSSVDVPTSVILTEKDSAVSPEAQLRMALAIPGSHINRIAGGHVSCVDPDFGRHVTDACLQVQRDIDEGHGAVRSPAADGV